MNKINMPVQLCVNGISQNLPKADIMGIRNKIDIKTKLQFKPDFKLLEVTL